MYRSLLNPVSDLQQLVEFIDRAFAPLRSESSDETAPTYALPVDIFQKDNVFYVRAAVPGVAPSDLDIQVQNGIMTIRAESFAQSIFQEDVQVWRREYAMGKYQRSLRLPEFADVEHIEAHFENGFVTVSVPLAIQTPKSLKIAVQTGTQPALGPSTGKNGSTKQLTGKA